MLRHTEFLHGPLLYLLQLIYICLVLQLSEWHVALQLESHDSEVEESPPPTACPQFFWCCSGHSFPYGYHTFPGHVKFFHPLYFQILLLKVVLNLLITQPVFIQGNYSSPGARHLVSQRLTLQACQDPSSCHPFPQEYQLLSLISASSVNNFTGKFIIFFLSHAHTIVTMKNALKYIFYNCTKFSY